ncbi:FAD binding domain-containing protein [Nocardioides sp. W7]|uniref:FAD binding domain-containing protein n=1 Tax=Nocardioides sp. W7 TaxID=2931390 RepID=UPI001FD178B7|nr:FAD binding domain-containing protein [Nocardioides sp. W7]
MDLGTVRSFRPARSRADLELAGGEVVVAGGTWLFSEPQVGTTGLVDLTTLGWEPFELLADGTLRIAATCTVEQLQAAPWGPLAGLARQAADGLLMSFKVQRVATVGGNLCLALPAGAMTSLTAGLGAEAVIWTPDGGERREPVSAFVRGVGTTSLAPGEVLRAIEVPPAALAERAALRRTSLTPLGRSAAMVVGSGRTVTVTASTTRPVVLDAHDLDAGLAAVDCWYDDAHGAADWRAAVTGLLAHEVVEELLA